MSRHLTSRVWLPLLACVMALLMQVAGVHLHLCLAAGESPMSVHATGTGHHADHHEEGQHQDIDLAWVADSALKPPQAALTLPPLLLAVVWVCLLAAVRRTGPARAQVPLVPPSFPLQRPPLRGPPSFSR
jgi:hypothetical protein